MTNTSAELFIATFELMEPEECLRITDEMLSARQSKAVLGLDLSEIIPLEYAVAYGTGDMIKNAPMPRSNPLEPEKPQIELEIERDPEHMRVIEPMILRGDRVARVFGYTVGLLNVAFVNYYLLKPSREQG